MRIPSAALRGLRGNLTNDSGKVYTYTQANQLTAVSGTGLSWSAAYNGDSLYCVRGQAVRG